MERDENTETDRIVSAAVLVLRPGDALALRVPGLTKLLIYDPAAAEFVTQTLQGRVRDAGFDGPVIVIDKDEDISAVRRAE